MGKHYIVAVDVDGTVVPFDWPGISDVDIGAERVLKRLVEAGHKLILWTVRSGPSLDCAVGWFARRNIPLWGINKNPTQHEWSDSPKAHAQVFIDDYALGAPLKWDLELSEKPFIDWRQVEIMLENKGLLKKEYVFNATSTTNCNSGGY